MHKLLATIGARFLGQEKNCPEKLCDPDDKIAQKKKGRSNIFIYLFISILIETEPGILEGVCVCVCVCASCLCMRNHGKCVPDAPGQPNRRETDTNSIRKL